MKIQIPKTIMTPQGEVNILPYASRDKYMKGLVDGWKVGYLEAIFWTQVAQKDWDKIEFIEAGK